METEMQNLVFQKWRAFKKTEISKWEWVVQDIS